MQENRWLWKLLINGVEVRRFPSGDTKFLPLDGGIYSESAYTDAADYVGILPQDKIELVPIFDNLDYQV